MTESSFRVILSALWGFLEMLPCVINRAFTILKTRFACKICWKLLFLRASPMENKLIMDAAFSLEMWGHKFSEIMISLCYWFLGLPIVCKTTGNLELLEEGLIVNTGLMFNCILIFNKVTAAFLNLGLGENWRIYCHQTRLSLLVWSPGTWMCWMK